MDLKSMYLKLSQQKLALKMISKTKELQQRIELEKFKNDYKLMSMVFNNRLKEQKMNTAGWTSNDSEQPSANVKTALQHYLEQQQQLQAPNQQHLAQGFTTTNISNAWPANITQGTVTLPSFTFTPMISGTTIYPVQVPVDRKAESKDFYSKLKALAKAEPHKVAPRVPDRVEPIVGYRAWKALQQGLGSIGNGYVWNKLKEMPAVCDQRIDHSAPVLNCECGIWAFKTQKDLEEAIGGYLDGTDMVVGQVYLWGRLIECERGYRAEFAYPKEIWCLRDEHKQLGMAYNVPVRTLA